MAVSRRSSLAALPHLGHGELGDAALPVAPRIGGFCRECRLGQDTFGQVGLDVEAELALGLHAGDACGHDGVQCIEEPLRLVGLLVRHVARGIPLAIHAHGFRVFRVLGFGYQDDFGPLRVELLESLYRLFYHLSPSRV